MKFYLVERVVFSQETNEYITDIVGYHENVHKAIRSEFNYQAGLKDKSKATPLNIEKIIKEFDSHAEYLEYSRKNKKMDSTDTDKSKELHGKRLAQLQEAGVSALPEKYADANFGELSNPDWGKVKKEILSLITE